MSGRLEIGFIRWRMLRAVIVGAFLEAASTLDQILSILIRSLILELVPFEKA